jgi:ribonuclease HIII
MAESKLQATIDIFRGFIQGNGWTILEERKIQNGFQLLVTDGVTRVAIDCYTNGNASIRGSAGTLKADLQNWWQQRKASPASPLLEQAELPATVKTIVEAFHAFAVSQGKGDYFGPLVIGAVYVDKRTEDQLKALGVRDSKLLAWGHAWTLEQMLEKVPCNLAIIDQFGDKSYILQALREKGRSITIEQHPRAEEDVAVAAASILARARFVQQLDQLSRRVGQALPKGASDPAIVAVGRELVDKFGKDILTEVAKLHFKTTQTILQTN